jgi:hypothetical protein
MLNKQHIGTCAIGLLGVILGGALVTLLERPKADRAKDDHAKEVAVQYVPSSSPTAGEAISSLERRLSMLESAAAASVRSPNPPPPNRTEQAGRQQTPEEARAVGAEMRTKREAQFSGESVDPRWAGGAVKSFRSDLEQVMPKLHAELTDVECRMTMCKAKIQWPTYGDARKSSESLLHMAYQLNCSKDIYTLHPENPDQPYEASVYFECTDARAQP